MVAIGSVNPQDQAEFAYPFGEEKMVDFISNWLKKENLDCRVQPVSPGRSNVFSFTPGVNNNYTLLLCGHMDTVGIGDMSIDPFDPQANKEKIFGRGACDDKCPLAAMMIAYRNYTQKTKPPCNLAMLATCGEEYDMEGARYFVRHTDKQFNAVIVAEPTELNVMAAHKGVLRIRVATRGKSAHSSTTELGINAINAMADVIKSVESFSHNLTGYKQHPLLGQETLAVTTIQGGRQINVIPDSCQLQIDWRILPGLDPRQRCLELQNAIKKMVNVPLEVELLSVFEPMETDSHHPLTQSLWQTARKVQPHSQLSGAAYATDASAFANLDIPAVVFGPGTIRQAHTQDEYITIEQLEKAEEVYDKFYDQLQYLADCP